MTAVALSLLTLTAAVEPAAIVFAPPVDRGIEIVASDVREGPARTLRFEIRRRVTFRRDGAGWRAEVETLGVSEDAGRAGDLFAAVMDGMAGQRIVLRLDARGSVIDVDDLDRQWAARADAVAAGVARSGLDKARAARGAVAVAALRASPRADRIARLSEVLRPIVPVLPLPAEGRRAITVPMRRHDGSTAALSGTETVTASDSTVAIVRNATGAIDGATIDRTQQMSVDTATGLAREAVERIVTTTPTGLSTVIRTVRTITPVS